MNRQSRRAAHRQQGVAASRTSRKVRLLQTTAVIVGILGLSGAIAVLARPQSETAGTRPVPPNGYYDAATDRYWCSNHGTWHAGRPPAAGTTTTTTTPTPLVSTGSVTPGAVAPGSVTQIQSPPDINSIPSPIPNPQDGYYDAPNNRHWHAGHGHWHQGPPPASGSTGATTRPGG